MHQENCLSTSTETPLSPEQLSAEEHWAERMKPSRQRQLTQSQRDRLARALKAGRRAHFQEIQSGLTESFEDRTGRSAQSEF